LAALPPRPRRDYIRRRGDALPMNPTPADRKPPPVPDSPATARAFLAALGSAMRSLADAVAIQGTASALLARHLGAQRVAYFEVLGDDYSIERDHTEGVASLTGRFPMASFGQRLLEHYRSGRTAVSHDVAGDASLTAAERAAFAAVEVGAYIGVPLLKNGVFEVGLSVHVRGPRRWTAQEIALVEETAERTWAAVLRARAEESALRSAQRYRALFDSIDQALCTIEVL